MLDCFGCFYADVHNNQGWALKGEVSFYLQIIQRSIKAEADPDQSDLATGWGPERQLTAGKRALLENVLFPI